MEEKYFSAFFARKTGTCFMLWLRRRRVARAIALMGSNNASITEIAFAAGFRDLRMFERTFKKCTGRTARDYKHTIAIRYDSASAA